MTSFLFDCRETAKNCPDILLRKLLRDATDELAESLQILNISPTTERMQRVVGLWTRAQKAKDKALPNPEPIPPTAGAGELQIEPERMAA